MTTSNHESPPPLPLNASIKKKSILILAVGVALPILSGVALADVYLVFEKVTPMPAYVGIMVDVAGFASLYPFVFGIIRRFSNKMQLVPISPKMALLNFVTIPLLILATHLAMIISLANHSLREIKSSQPQRGESSQPGVQPRVSGK